MTPASSPRSFPTALLGLLRCVACGHVGLDAPSADSLACPACRHTYPLVEGIPDLTPAEMLPLPAIYGDDDFQKWLGYQAKSRQFFYRPGSLMAFIQNAGHRAIQRMRRRKPDGVILDLGSGDGHHYPYLDAGERAFGADLDQRSLALSRHHHPSFPVIRADACNLPIADVCIDTVINVYNLEHIIHLDFALEEMKRVLKRDGEALIALPTEGSFAWLSGRRLSTGPHFSREGFDYMRAQEIDHINCIWQLEKALRRHFKVEQVRYFPSGLPSFHLNLIITFRCTMR